MTAAEDDCVAWLRTAAAIVLREWAFDTDEAGFGVASQDPTWVNLRDALKATEPGPENAA